MAGNEELSDQCIAFKPQLFVMALGFTKNEQDASDLVQDTLLKACRFDKYFEPGSNLKAWLCTILRNTYINNYRKRQKYDECDVETISHRYPVKEESEEFFYYILEYEIQTAARTRCGSPGIQFRDIKPALSSMLSDTMLSALEGIPEINAIPLILCDLLDIQYKEAASMIGCPIGTLMSRVFRGRRKLQVLLALAVEHTGQGGVVLKEMMWNVSGQAV